jgi:thymidylate synthase (FAD)
MHGLIMNGDKNNTSYLKCNVLDDGFVILVDSMGSDSSIVQAARVSYGEGTKKTSEDRHLIRYMMRNHHTSPFEMCEVKLHVRVPMDCWRQWIRHRTASVNEYSTRYSIAIDSMMNTDADKWRMQDAGNRQGSKGFINSDIGSKLSQVEYDLHLKCREVYEERINLGVAREQARKDLPLSTYTEAYWKIDLHNLLHFLELRMEQHAQFEIRQYANVIGYNIVGRLFPLTWEAFLDYRLNAITLSDLEIGFISMISAGKGEEVLSHLQENGWLERIDDKWKLYREAQEFASKLNRLRIPIPWNK